jgi:hypothetical protein
MLVTDLNHRERRSYVELFEKMAEAATRAADALRSSDDSRAFTELASVVMLGMPLRQLVDIFTEAQNVVIPTTAPTE